LAIPSLKAEEVPSGTVVKVQLNTPLNSKTASRGERVTATVTQDDNSGLPPGTRLTGYVTQVQRATKNQPGILDVTFRNVQTGRRTVPTIGYLASLDESASNDTGSTFTGGKKKPNKVKFIGYGAAGGAILGQVLGHNMFKGALLGAAAGYVYGLTQKGGSKYHDVALKQGTEFGVVLQNPIDLNKTSTQTYRRSSGPGRVLGSGARDQARARATDVGTVLGAGADSTLDNGDGTYQARIDGRSAVLRRQYADRARAQVPEGTVVKVELMGYLSSKTAKVGDRVTAQVSPDDYSGIVPGTLITGRVVEARPAAKNRPGVLDIQFDRLDSGNGLIPISGDLAGLGKDEVSTAADGRLVSKRKSGSKLKFLGYGAAGGALLGQLLGEKPLIGALAGAAAGYLYGQSQKSKGSYRDVELKEGSEFGVRLSRDIRTRV
jgi:hypothetical protein